MGMTPGRRRAATGLAVLAAGRTSPAWPLRRYQPAAAMGRRRPLVGL